MNRSEINIVAVPAILPPVTYVLTIDRNAYRSWPIVLNRERLYTTT
jgi:hypothetical protein